MRPVAFGTKIKKEKKSGSKTKESRALPVASRLTLLFLN